MRSKQLWLQREDAARHRRQNSSRSQTVNMLLTCLCFLLEKKTPYLPLNFVMIPVQIVILFALSSLTTAWIVPQPHQNIWVTLAQMLQQENICLSTAAAKDPMSTCLVGIPWQAAEYPDRFDTHMPNPNPKSHNQSQMQPNEICHRRAVMIKKSHRRVATRMAQSSSGTSRIRIVGFLSSAILYSFCLYPTV